MNEPLPYSRVGQSAPRWLVRAFSVVAHGTDADRNKLLALAQGTIDEPEDPDDHPWAEPPGVLMMRALAQIAAARPGAQSRLPEPPSGANGHWVALRNAWIHCAANSAFLERADPDWDGPKPENPLRHRCALRVLLYDREHESGVHAWLELTRIAHPGGGLQFVPAPVSALTPLGSRFQRSLDIASGWLRSLFDGAGIVAPEAVFAWSLYPLEPQRQLVALVGDSASAAFAYGGLWLLGTDLPLPWREPLTRIERSQLAGFAISAAIDKDGLLVPVGHASEKFQSLQASSMAAGERIPVHVAIGQAVASRPGAAAADIHPHASMLDLATHAANRASELDATERLLRESLLESNPSVPALSDAELDRIGSRRARTWLQHALFGWARWARRGSGRLPYLFVKLTVNLPRATVADARDARRSYDSVHSLLADPEMRHKPALLLHGQPGAGKTTLLRHHAQWLYRQAVIKLAAGQEPEEWPLYLTLADLPEDEADVVGWVRRHAQDQFGGRDPLLDLLRPGATEARGVPRLRLLLDGLNELKVRRASDRHARATRVLLQLRRAFSPENALLLSARTRHRFEIIQTDDGMAITPIELFKWGLDEMRQYIALRFDDDPAYAAARFKQLWQNEQTRDLCAIPMQMAQQCDLWQWLKGSPHGETLFTERAGLYAAWLWLRLQRGLSRKESGHARIPELVEDELLLTEDDQDDIQASRWLGTGLHRLPQRGLLLPTLIAQARRQWRAAPRGEDDTPRGAVQVPAHEAGSELLDRPDGARLRQRWLAAVQDLGLAEISRTVDGDLFRFIHPSWGEFFASRDLLVPDPQAMSPAALDRLLREFTPPELPTRDVQQLHHLRSQTADAWSVVLPLFTTEWLARGFSIPLPDFQDWLNERSPEVQAGYRQFIVSNADFVEDGARCSVSLLSWARSDRRMRPFGDDWQRNPLAWRELVMSVLWKPFQKAFLHLIEKQLGVEAVGRMMQVDRLSSMAGDLDEPLVLAVQALANPLPWLQALTASGLLAAAAQCALGVRHRVEPNPWSEPHPVLQALRGLLLLRSVDAGAGVRQRIRRAGVLQAMARAAPATGMALHGTWRAAERAAFHGVGVDLRRRIEAGSWLGWLNDTLRLELSPSRLGLRLRAEHWVTLGDDVADCIRHGREPAFRECEIGQAGSDESGEAPCAVRLRGFALASLAVTVAEWRAFIEAGGYVDAEASHWRSVGTAAQDWLRHRQIEAEGRGQAVAPQGWQTTDRENPSLPVTGITWFEAMAYAAWVDEQCNDPRSPWRLALPTEVHWEAGTRGPNSPLRHWRKRATVLWPHGAEQDDEETAMATRFNHIATRWGKPTPVGVFSPGYSPTGLADAAGNVWQWCANTFRDDYQREDGAWAAGPQPGGEDTTARRALRGGSYLDTAASCRTAYRGHGLPNFEGQFVGVRLALIWRRPG